MNEQNQSRTLPSSLLFEFRTPRATAGKSEDTPLCRMQRHGKENANYFALRLIEA
jgi:hypothetical protein